MDFQGFRRFILAQHSGKPQNLLHLEIALRDLQSALEVLARFGHRYHLEEGPGSKMPEWPRMMFHITSAPNGRLVRDEYELWDLGDGWCDSLEEAQVRDGYAHQMRGRGGLQRPGLPAIISKMPSVEEVLAKKAEKYRRYRELRNLQRQAKELKNGTE